MPEGLEDLETDDDVIDDDGAGDESPGTPPGDDEDPDGTGTPPAEGAEDEPPQPGTKAWADLEKKYPGLSEEDLRDKVALQYWDQTRALSKVSKAHRALELKIAKLEGRLEAGTPPKETEPEAQPPEVAQLDSYIHDLTERDKQVGDAQVQTLKDINEANAKVGEIKGLILAAKQAQDEDKQSRLEGRLETAEARVENLRDRLGAQVRERKDIARDKGRAHQERDWYGRLHREGKARQEAEEADLQEQYEQAPRIVNAQITEVIQDSGIPADPALRQDLRETLQSKITVDLWKAGQRGLPFAKVDIAGLLKQHTDKYIKAHGIAKRADFQRRSEGRTQVTTPTRTAPTTPRSDGKPAARTPVRTVISGTGALAAGMLRGRRLLERKGY